MPKDDFDLPDYLDDLVNEGSLKLPPIRTFAVTVPDEHSSNGERLEYIYAHRFDVELGGVLVFGTGVVLMVGGKPTPATLTKHAYKEWISVTEIEKPTLSH